MKINITGSNVQSEVVNIFIEVFLLVVIFSTVTKDVLEH